MEQFWRMNLEVETRSAFHTLGPGRSLPLVDRALQVDAEGYPMLSGSTVKGRVRSHLERLLKALKRPVCRPPRPDQMCPHFQPVDDRLASLKEPYCLACRIFGSAWRESAVTFGGFFLTEELKREGALPVERTSVGISRRLGSAQAERLFFSQTTAPASTLRFVGQIEGRMTQEEIGWLLIAFNLVTHLGGDKARGLGRVRLRVTGLSCWNPETRTWEEVEPRTLVKEVVNRATL